MVNELIETYNDLKENKEALYTHTYKTKKAYKAHQRDMNGAILLKKYEEEILLRRQE
ncbi:MAG: hypothetical protein LBP19_04435 [Treponema sp.]|jgi:site-specific DNA-adenine methylase|nr:hypothetical protein [Treponema sp.]